MTFEEWLNTQKITPSTIATQLKRIKRIRRAYPDLDEQYESDAFKNLHHEFDYSRRDEQEGRHNPSRLDINGNIYNNLASYRATLTRYMRYKQSTDNKPLPNPKLVSQASGENQFDVCSESERHTKRAKHQNNIQADRCSPMGKTMAGSGDFCTTRVINGQVVHEYSILDLLGQHSKILSELRHRGVLRSKNNPVGDYGEWLVSRSLGLTLEKNSVKGFDAKDASGFRYQIKARRITPDNRSTQLSVIRNLEGKGFDFLIAVILNEAWQIQCAAIIPHKTIFELATFRAHVNGYVMHLRQRELSHPEVKNISEMLRN